MAPTKRSVPSETSPVIETVGRIGNLLGSKEHAPTYIAGILALIALLGAIAVGLWAPESPEKPDLLKTLGSIVIAALTFIGGASSNRGSG